MTARQRSNAAQSTGSLDWRGSSAIVDKAVATSQRMAENALLAQAEERRNKSKALPLPLRVALFMMLGGILLDTGYPIQAILRLGPGLSGRKAVAPAYITPSLVVPPEVPAPPWGRVAELMATIHTKYLHWADTLTVHNENGVTAMRRAGLLASEALDVARAMVAPGVTTDAIDAAVHQFIVSHNAYPTTLGFKGYPKSTCTSVNEIMVHGIPDERPLEEGDIVNVDVTVYLDGMHADTSATFIVGTNTTAKALEVMAVTRQALEAAVAACGPGKPYRVIGQAVQAVADRHGASTVRAFVGHGIGPYFHSAPRVHHFAPRGWWDMSGWIQVYFSSHYWSGMVPGSTFTIEPILVEPGGSTRFMVWADKWTAASVDGSLSAQYEYTVLVQEPGEDEGQGGCEVLTPFAWEVQLAPHAQRPAATTASE